MRRAAGFLALWMMAGTLGACASDSIEDRRRGQDILCHDGKKTMSVSNASALDHYQHGDSPGPCPDGD